MKEKELDNKIDNAIEFSKFRSGFGPTLVPFHEHTGVDSPRIDYKNLVGSSGSTTHYIGAIQSNVAGTPFPTGWSVVNNSTGIYTITHNLGNTTYVVIASGLGSAGVPVISARNATTFVISWYSLAANLQSMDFNFDLII